VVVVVVMFGVRLGWRQRKRRRETRKLAGKAGKGEREGGGIRSEGAAKAQAVQCKMSSERAW
jgi:hypothetical protein